MNSTPNISDKATIAVLPFVNMSVKEENEYFSDGITEEIINALAKITALKVTSRTSSFYFKGKNIPIVQIGRTLGVSIILEGSVRLSGNAIRITAQLIDAKEDFHFWSETWDRQLDNIFEVQDEVSLSIADKLREQVGHFEIDERLDARNTEVSAYQWYLKSKSSFAKFQKAAILTAVSEIENAIAIDAECPFYHASKAIYYSYLGLINAISVKEAFTNARKAGLRALELDATDPEANYAVGTVYFFFEKDIKTAETYLFKALKYRPNYVNALLGGSVMDVISGNYEQSLTRVRKAMELDPLTTSNLYYYASALQRMGRYEEALVEVNTLLEKIPNHTNSYCLKGTILTHLERFDEAVSHFQTVPIGGNKTVAYYAGMGIAYAAGGDKSKAEEYLLKCKEEAQNLHLASEENPFVMINIYLGNVDDAFQEIEKDVAEGKYYLNFYREIPAFKLIANDPRYSIFDNLIKVSNTALNQPSTEKKPLLSKKHIDDYSKKLLHYMAIEKPFLDETLSLRQLSKHLKLTPNQLSLVLNEGLGKNFNSFVNRYRVEEFMRIVKDPGRSNITIAGLAFECGFNSKTVFNTYFKEITGLTPSEFMKS